MKLQNLFTITILVSLLFFTSCTVRLTPKGAAVRVIDSTVAQECHYIGAFSSTTGSGSQNKVLNHLKNQIAQAGGNAFVVSAESSSSLYQHYSIAADAYKCNFHKEKDTGTKADTALLERLRTLKKLHQEGLLTDDEYNSMKEKIIDKI